MPAYQAVPPSDLIRSVDRALTLVDVVGASVTGLLVQDIAVHLDLSVPATRHYVASLTYHGHLTRWRDRRYTLGPVMIDRLHDLAAQMAIRHRAGATAGAIAEHLRQPKQATYELLGHGIAACTGTCSCNRPPAATRRPRDANVEQRRLPVPRQAD